MLNSHRCCSDTFEDAILMGVDEAAMRGILAGMIEGLESPKRSAR